MHVASTFVAALDNIVVAASLQFVAAAVDAQTAAGSTLTKSFQLKPSPWATSQEMLQTQHRAKVLQVSSGFVQVQ